MFVSVILKAIIIEGLFIIWFIFGQKCSLLIIDNLFRWNCPFPTHYTNGWEKLFIWQQIKLHTKQQEMHLKITDDIKKKPYYSNIVSPSLIPCFSRFSSRTDFKVVLLVKNSLFKGSNAILSGYFQPMKKAVKYKLCYL